MTGARVVSTLLTVAFATAVLPPAAAWTVNRRRIDRSRADAATIASLVETRIGRDAALSTTQGVLSGPGRMPLAGTRAADAWLTAPRRSLATLVGDAAVLPTDPWGNAYVVSAARVLSAGPNGLIDTPFPSTGAAGDDVAVRIW